MTTLRWATPPQKQIQRVEVPTIVIQNPEISVETTIEFIKKMTVIAVSTITYLRGVFPEDAFMVKKLEDQQVFVLKRNVGSSETLSEWLTCAFGLVNSHHLRKIILLMKQGDVTMECYTFSFTYDEDAISCDLQGEVNGKEVLPSQSVPADISRSIRNLMRSILVSCTILQPLPNGVELSLKLQLDETTPLDLVPPGFEPSSSEAIVNFPIEIDSMRLGRIKTKFATFGVTTKSILYQENYEEFCKVNNEKQKQNSEDVEIPGSQVDQMTSVLNTTSQSHKKSNDNKELNNSYVSDTSSVASKEAENDSNLTEALSIVSLKEKTISCICECSLLDNTIQCVSCSTYQHKTCYKLLECHSVDIHICVSCHDPEQGKICSVPELLNDVNRKASALYRQALMYCCTSSQVSCKRIMAHLKVPRRVAEKIFQELDNNGCFEPATNTGHFRDVKLGLKEYIGQNFVAPPPSHNTHMNSPVVSADSFTSAHKKTNEQTKRQLEEEKENTLSDEFLTCSASKRAKIVKSTTDLKKSFY